MIKNERKNESVVDIVLLTGKTVELSDLNWKLNLLRDGRGTKQSDV